jgi:uncharacterized protein (TIGR03435 family)
VSTEAVVAYLAKVTLVLALAWVCSAALRRASAAARHQVWASAVLGVLVLPMLVWAVPVWRVVVATRTEVVDPGGVTSVPLLEATGSMPVTVAPASASASVRVSGITIALVAWAAGSMILFTRLVWGFAQLWRLRRRAAIVERRADGVLLLESASANSMPMAWGWREPCVLFPAGFREWDRERLDVVLAHELAHIRRRDWAVQIAAEIVKCLHWFHPLAWLPAARVREESEGAADDAVMLGGVAGLEYAKHLLEVARMQQPGVGGALAMAGRAPIERRLRAVLDRKVRRGVLSGRAIACSIAAVVITLVPLAAFLPAQEVRRVVAQAEQQPVVLRAQAEPPKSPASMAPAAQATTDRVLSPGDQILIRSNAEEMNRTQRVDDDGNIQVPLIGPVAASGKTAAELEREMITRLRRFLVAPQVSISVVTAATAMRAFEVVSIRPNPGPWRVLKGYNAAGPAVTLEGYNLQWLITDAYGIEEFQVVMNADLPHEESSPGAMFNIAAKAPGDATPTRAEVREMLQEMLASRFKMKFHWETREMPVYALVRGKNGIKFRESKPDQEKSGRGTVEGRIQTMHRTVATMADLARDLRNYVDRPVVDKTGLTGNYDYEVGATVYPRLERNRQPDDVDIVDAIEDSLGLRLEKVREQVPVLVVDAVEGPSEN